MRDATRALALAAVSGGVSYAACFLPDGFGARWGAGIVFGALVLAPSLRGTRDRIAALVLSTAVYRAAVWLAQELHVAASWPAVVACALAGAAGAIALSLAASAALHSQTTARARAGAAAIGAGAGALIGLGIDAPDEALIQRLLLLAGFVAWQVGYTAAHRLRA